MYTLRTTQEFDKDVKRCKKNGRNMQLLRDVVELLEENGSVPEII